MEIGALAGDDAVRTPPVDATGFSRPPRSGRTANRRMTMTQPTLSSRHDPSASIQPSVIDPRRPIGAPQPAGGVIAIAASPVLSPASAA